MADIHYVGCINPVSYEDWSQDPKDVPYCVAFDPMKQWPVDRAIL